MRKIVFAILIVAAVAMTGMTLSLNQKLGQSKAAFAT